MSEPTALTRATHGDSWGRVFGAEDTATPQSDEILWEGLLPELTKGFVPWLGDTASPKGLTRGASEQTPCSSLFIPRCSRPLASGGRRWGLGVWGSEFRGAMSEPLLPGPAKPGFGSEQDTKDTPLHAVSAGACACAHGGAGALRWAVSFRPGRIRPGDAFGRFRERRSLQVTRRTASPSFGKRSQWWVGGYTAIARPRSSTRVPSPTALPPYCPLLPETDLAPWDGSPIGDPGSLQPVHQAPKPP